MLILISFFKISSVNFIVTFAKSLYSWVSTMQSFDYKTLSDSAVAKTTDARIVIVLRLQFAKVNMKRRVIDLKGI